MRERGQIVGAGLVAVGLAMVGAAWLVPSELFYSGLPILGDFTLTPKRPLLLGAGVCTFVGVRSLLRA